MQSALYQTTEGRPFDAPQLNNEFAVANSRL
jgi:hypothetical protein